MSNDPVVLRRVSSDQLPRGCAVSAVGDDELVGEARLCPGGVFQVVVLHSHGPSEPTLIWGVNASTTPGEATTRMGVLQVAPPSVDVENAILGVPEVRRPSCHTAYRLPSGSGRELRQLIAGADVLAVDESAVLRQEPRVPASVC